MAEWMNREQRRAAARRARRVTALSSAFEVQPEPVPAPVVVITPTFTG